MPRITQRIPYRRSAPSDIEELLLGIGGHGCYLALLGMVGSFRYRCAAAWHRWVAALGFSAVHLVAIQSAGVPILPRITQRIQCRWRATLDIEELLLGIVGHGWQFQVSKSCCLASLGTVGSFGNSLPSILSGGDPECRCSDFTTHHPAHPISRAGDFRHRRVAAWPPGRRVISDQEFG